MTEITVKIRVEVSGITLKDNHIYLAENRGYSESDFKFVMTSYDPDRAITNTVDLVPKMSDTLVDFLISKLHKEFLKPIELPPIKPGTIVMTSKATLDEPF